MNVNTRNAKPMHEETVDASLFRKYEIGKETFYEVRPGRFIEAFSYADAKIRARQFPGLVFALYEIVAPGTLFEPTERYPR